MNSKFLRAIFVLACISMVGVACSGKGVRSAGYYRHHHDFYYRNPWNDFDRFRRPIIIAPPPVISPPPDMGIDPDFGVEPPVFEAVPML